MSKNFMKVAGLCLGIFALSRPAAAQLKIGNNGTTIDPSSILELENPNKALYLTRVALTGTTDITTVPNPKAGMVVYNTNTAITGTIAHPAGTGGLGVYFFNGTAWIYSGGSLPTASNGLVDTANNIELGGTLLHNTTINGGAFNTAVTGNSTASQSSAFTVTAAPGNSIPQGAQIFGGQAFVSGTDGVGAASSNLTTLRGQVSQASTSGNNVRAQGSLNEGASAGHGLGQYDQPQATGATGEADYTGNTDADSADFITGLRGATYTSSNSINGLNVAGVTFDGTYRRSIGGYFYPTGGTVANVGIVGQVGGSVNQGWRDTALNNKNIGIVAMNYNAPSANDLAIYSSGAVKMKGLTGTGNNVLTIDSSGIVGSTNASTLIAAGNGLTKNGNIIGLGGTLDSSTIIDANGSTLYIGDDNNDGVTRQLNVFNNVSGTVPSGSAPYTTSTAYYYAGTANTGTLAGTQGGLYSLSSTNAGDFQAQGALLEAQTTGGNGDFTHAVGGFGLVTGNSTTASAQARVIGISGATNFPGTGNNFNGIGVSGYNAFSGNATLGRTAGGFFNGTGGATEFGVMGQVGGSRYQSYYDAAQTGRHIAVSAVNANAPGANQLAIYSSGAVQMTGLTGAGTNLLTVDANGNVGTTAAAAVSGTASNGLVDTAGNVELGGTLIHNTTINGGNFLATFNSTSTANQTAGFNINAAPGNAIPSGNEVFGANIHLEGSDNQPATAAGNETVLRAAVNYARSTGSTPNHTRVQGSLNEGVASGFGLGTNLNIEQAIGTTGLGFYEGAATAGDADYIDGVLGSTIASGGAINGINLYASPSFGNFLRSIGGYFYPNSGSTANLGIVSQTGGTKNQAWKDPTFTGKNISVAGINYGTGTSEYAGYFLSNNSASNTPALYAANTISSNFPANTNPMGAVIEASGTDGVATPTGSVSVVTALYPHATTTGNNVQTQAVLAEAVTSGSGLGAAGNYGQVVGSFGLADYVGNTNAGALDYITGTSGSPYVASNAINGIGVSGSPYSGTGYYRMIGGYFRANGASVDNASFLHANLGMVAQVGGTKNQAWRETALNNKNIGVVAMNYNTPSANDLAIYSSGAVQMTNLGATTPINVLGIDAAGNVSATALPATVNAGDGLNKHNNIIGLGGMLDSNTTINANKFTLNITDNNNDGVTRQLNVANNVTTALPGGSAPYATSSAINYSGTENTGTLAGTTGGLYSLSSTGAGDFQAQGALLEAQTTGGNGDFTHAVGGFGLVTGNSTTASAQARVVGMSGATNFPGTGNNFNGIGVSGYNAFSGNATLGRTAGGFFNGTGGATEFGVMGQVGGSRYQSYYDAAQTGRHIAVSAVNANAPGANQLALYSSGAVQMTGLTGTGTNLLTVDVNGNVGTTAAAAVSGTASNGLVDTAGNVELGGTLIHNTTVAAGANTLAVNGNNPISNVPVLAIDNTITTNFTVGSNPFGSTSNVSGTDGVATPSGSVSVVTGNYSSASTTGNNVQPQAILAQSTTSGIGLGSSTGGNFAQTVGAFGLAVYSGNTNAGSDDYVSGTAGSPYVASNAINGIGITGSPYSGSGYYRMIGGYFRANGGTVDNGAYHHANLGLVSQVGGTKNQAWRDAVLNDKNVGVVAINYNSGTPVAATASDLAIYSSGNVQMANLPGTGNIVAIDASGNLSKTAPLSATTVLTGSGPLYVAVPAGGTQDADINSAAFNSANPGDVVSVGVPPGQLSTYPGVTFFAFVKQSGIVTVRLFNTGNSAIGMGMSGAVYFGIVTAKVFQ